MKNMFKNKNNEYAIFAGVFIILLALLVLMATGTIGTGSGKIYSADIEKIMSEHPAFSQAISNFEREFADMRKKLEKMKGEEKAKEQQKMQQEIQELAMQMQKEAVDTVLEDVRSIAKRKGYAYIVDSKMLISGGKDVTEEIIAEIKGDVNKPATDKPTDASVMPAIPVK